MPIPVLYLDAQKKTALDNGFAAAFGTAPERYFSAPGRTEIGGNHTDHQRGTLAKKNENAKKQEKRNYRYSCRMLIIDI